MERCVNNLPGGEGDGDGEGDGEGEGEGEAEAEAEAEGSRGGVAAFFSRVLMSEILPLYLLPIE